MTRMQVARRLGKSLATVRRIEGVLLYPARDARGVHRFDPAEVEGLANDIEQGRVALARELRRPGTELPMRNAEPDSECGQCLEFEQEVEVLHGRLEQQRLDHARQLEALRSTRDRESAKYESEARELMERVSELVEALEA